MDSITNLLNNTNLVNELSSLESNELEGVAKNLLSEYGWLFFAGVAIILIKDVMMNFAKGIMVFYGSHYNNDDIIYISGRQARIVRVGITTTTFYMTDRKSKMIVPNEQLKELTIEKTLPINGGSPYLPKGGDSDFKK
mgnify:CR=1 FL=1|tara:strand:- start:186 stop:599 length:414 start_codon:yes stop_codon:yes gene_type:complete